MKSALLVIDLQHGLFHGQSQPFEGGRVLEKSQALIVDARKAGAPVVFVQHYSPPGTPLARGSKLWDLVEGLAPEPQDIRIQKMRPSIFFQTDLRPQLNAAGIDRLILCGMKTDYCIDTSCRVAAEFGFKVVLASDAHTTMDSAALPASAIIAHHNRTLGGPFAEVLPSGEVAF